MFWHTSVVMHDGVYMELAYEWKSWFPKEKGDIYFANSKAAVNRLTQRYRTLRDGPFNFQEGAGGGGGIVFF